MESSNLDNFCSEAHDILQIQSLGYSTVKQNDSQQKLSKKVSLLLIEMDFSACWNIVKFSHRKETQYTNST